MCIRDSLYPQWSSVFLQHFSGYSLILINSQSICLQIVKNKKVSIFHVTILNFNLYGTSFEFVFLSVLQYLELEILGIGDISWSVYSDYQASTKSQWHDRKVKIVTFTFNVVYIVIIVIYLLVWIKQMIYLKRNSTH